MKPKPLLSIILPAYNEEAIIEKNLAVIENSLRELENKYAWEICIINDGSKDRTGELADKLAAQNPKIRVKHHSINLNLGRALQTGFAEAKGDCIIVLDLDLSYSTEHIERLADKLFSDMADIVIASPYMKGGKVTDVPFLRALLSRVVNRFMRLAAQEKYHTFTGMVRAYRKEFIHSLNLKTKDYEVNPEIVYKAMILRARIIEIPAHLDWTEQNKVKMGRTSSIRILHGFFSGLMSGFIFRPYIFFIGFGFILLFISLYIIGWLLYHTISIMPELIIETSYFDDKFSYAIAQVFRERPHSFFVGGFTLLASIQVLSLGFMSLQSKRYFEELFHINTSILKKFKEEISENKQE